MGKYINITSKGEPLSTHNKASELIADGAVLLGNKPTNWVPNMICVVDNGLFEAAAYVPDEAEMIRFRDDGSSRPKVWMTHPQALNIVDK